MTNTLKFSSITTSLILLAGLIVSLFAALPAGAQQIAEKCTLGRSVKIAIQVGATPVPASDIASIQESSVVSPSGISIAGGIVKQDGTSVAFGSMTDLQKSAVGKKWGTICLVNTINTLSDWAFFILLTISFVFIAIAGFLWVTSAGDAEKQKTAGRMIAAALVGIVIAVIARIVPAVLTGILV